MKLIVFDELVFFNMFMIFMIVFGIIVFIALFYKTASYGKFIPKNCDPAINSKTGWAIMEIPTIIVSLC